MSAVEFFFVDFMDLQHRASVQLVICGGVHDPRLTDSFWRQVERQAATLGISLGLPLVLPVSQYPPYSPTHVWSFLQTSVSTGDVPLGLIGFSAGVVGAIAAANSWQARGGTVKTFIAFDGWGVPLYGKFPIYRCSHDTFTHISSNLLGRGLGSFYAEPAVDHLDLWQYPAQTWGWWVAPYQASRRTTASEFVVSILQKELLCDRVSL
jgi:hypothetical protein